jgi:biopolymer transport protein ExbD
VKIPFRRRRERRIQPASDLTITSMVDMFTMILTFLLNFVDPSIGEEGLLSLPTARATATPAEGVTIRVTETEIRVEDDLVARISGGALAAGTERAGGVIIPLADALRPLLGGDQLPLVLECDRRAPFSIVGEVLQSARVAGFSHYRFVVDREPK